MPVRVRKVKEKFRVVESDGGIAKTDKGTAVDGGGHSSKAAAQAQCNAINASKHGWKPTEKKRRK